MKGRRRKPLLRLGSYKPTTFRWWVVDIEGKYENELLILTPVAVKTELQRQHISKDLIEYGFVKAKELGFTAILVEGNPKIIIPVVFSRAINSE